MRENKCLNTTGYYFTAFRFMGAFTSFYQYLGGFLIPEGSGKAALYEERSRLTTIVGPPATLNMITSLGGNNE